MSKLSSDQQAIVKAVGVHLAIAAVLLISVTFSPEPVMLSSESNAPVMQATFIDAQAIADKKRAEQAAQAQAQEAQRQRQAKEAAAKERQRKETAARRAAEKKAADKKRRQEAERKKQLELKQLAAQQEKERKEREAKAKAEAAQKAKEAKEKAEMDKILQEQLEAERAAQAKRRQQQVLSEVDRYRALITATVQRYLIDDDSFTGKECRLNIRLATSGFVTQVTRLEGNDALCRAAESAVRRPDKLPMSDDPSVYEQIKDINITVRL
ncbi:cell envelope integrity protein TolA [Alteromonas sp. C1M14]|uniref:cell envelope integrity protein TolA n=1 Tax=Alteromonas sp. C1M14 TaxID=2841567 RepID=UPI001C08F859|nr:cell envelope integrity protein TolA [Alteromonas sp. C1M14]MBU2977418.1 cell envelope integrity protein TolA [Alteromonas sp. C1M14]